MKQLRKEFEGIYNNADKSTQDYAYLKDFMSSPRFNRNCYNDLAAIMARTIDQKQKAFLEKLLAKMRS
jgi:hypothetical protein